MPKTLSPLQVPENSPVTRAPDRQTFYSQHYQIKCELYPDIDATLIISQASLDELIRKKLVTPFAGAHPASEASKINY